MAPSRTRTIKNKHAANGSGIKSSKAMSKRPMNDGIIKSKNPNKKAPLTTNFKGRPVATDLLKKKKKRVYTEKELGIPQLNSIVPAGVQKPKGKKKGKVFVDDPESMNTLLAIAQAEKDGQIESKMMRARQMEEIREARRIEAEQKEADRQAKLDETKNSLRKKRKRPQMVKEESEKADVKGIASAGTKAAPKAGKKKVAFAE